MERRRFRACAQASEPPVKNLIAAAGLHNDPPELSLFSRHDLFAVRFLWGERARKSGFGAGFAFGTNLLDLVIGQTLQTNEGIMDFADPNELVKLDLNGGSIPVL
jgi:hypothetical protein